MHVEDRKTPERTRYDALRAQGYWRVLNHRARALGQSVQDFVFNRRRKSPVAYALLAAKTAPALPPPKRPLRLRRRDRQAALYATVPQARTPLLPQLPRPQKVLSVAAPLNAQWSADKIHLRGFLPVAARQLRYILSSVGIPLGGGRLSRTARHNAHEINRLTKGNGFTPEQAAIVGKLTAAHFHAGTITRSALGMAMAIGLTLLTNTS